MLKRITVFFVAIPFLTVGCQRLNDSRTVPLASFEVQSIMYGAPRGEQKVAVTLSSSGAPISAYLVLESDRLQAVEQAGNGQKPPKALGSVEKVEEGTLEGTVPAGEAFAVLISNRGNKPAQVQMTTTGR